MICHESVDEAAVGKFLCGVSGQGDWKEDNVWSRYDWCHYRNWGSVSKSDDEDGKANKMKTDEDDYNDEDKDEHWEERSKIHFVSVNKEGQQVTERTDHNGFRMHHGRLALWDAYGRP